MRALALSSLTVLLVLAADTARAQEFIPDPFTDSPAELRFGPSNDHTVRNHESARVDIFVDEPDYRDTGMGALRTDRTMFVPFGGNTLVSQSSSYYPVANMKLRYRSLFIANRLDRSTVFMIGAWEHRLRNEGMQTLKTSPTFGFQFAFSR